MEEESQGAAHFLAELSCQGAQPLPPRLQLSVGQSWGEEETLAGVGTKHLYKALREHLWKQNKCERPCWIGSVWLGTSAWEGTAPCTSLYSYLPEF